MAKTGLSIKLGPGWKEWHKWAAAFEGNLHQAALRGTKLACQYVMAEIIMRIKEGKYAKNSPLTTLLKKHEGYGDIPLVRTGGLIRSITTDVVHAYMGQVGLLKKGKGKDGTDYANIGELLHNGGTFGVTQSMRLAFIRRFGHVLGPSKPGSGKGYVRIKPRPFIKDVFEDPIVLAKVELIYNTAIKAVLGF
jgi:hypothetical protein